MASTARPAYPGQPRSACSSTTQKVRERSVGEAREPQADLGQAARGDGRRHELHDGELSATPVPTPRHQIVIGNFADVLRAHVRATGAGLVLDAPLDVIVNPTMVVHPVSHSQHCDGRPRRR